MFPKKSRSTQKSQHKSYQVLPWPRESVKKKPHKANTDSRFRLGKWQWCFRKWLIMTDHYWKTACTHIKPAASFRTSWFTAWFTAMMMFAFGKPVVSLCFLKMQQTFPLELPDSARMYDFSYFFLSFSCSLFSSVCSTNYRELSEPSDSTRVLYIAILSVENDGGLFCSNKVPICSQRLVGSFLNQLL